VETLSLYRDTQESSAKSKACMYVGKVIHSFTKCFHIYIYVCVCVCVHVCSTILYLLLYFQPLLQCISSLILVRYLHKKTEFASVLLGKLYQIRLQRSWSLDAEFVQANVSILVGIGSLDDAVDLLLL